MDLNIRIARKRATVKNSSEQRLHVARASSFRGIDSLPPELILRCFELISFRGRGTVVLVCRSWRQIAISSPKLWTLCRANIKTQSDLALLRFFITSSRTLPICLWIDTIRYDYEISKLVLQHIARIQFLGLNFHFHSKFELGAADAPILTGLHVWGSISLPRAPLLRTLGTTNAYFSGVDVCFHHLTSYEGDVSGPYSADLFKICPNLQRLTLSANGAHNIPTAAYWPLAPIPNSLVDLHIVDFHQHPGEYLRVYHNCTTLRSVRLRGKYEIEDILRLFDSIGPQLARLELQEDGIRIVSSTGFVAFLSSTDYPGRLGSSDTESGESLTSADNRQDKYTISHWLRITPDLQFRLWVLRNQKSLRLPSLETMTWTTTVDELKFHELMYFAPNLRVLVLHMLKITRENVARLSSVVERIPTICQENLRDVRLEKLVLNFKDLDDELGDSYDISRMVDLEPLRNCAQEIFHGSRRLVIDAASTL